MKEVPFVIPVSGVIRINGSTITIAINRTETSLILPLEAMPSKRVAFEPGRSMFDVVLETAQEIVKEKGFNRFSAPELYAKALDKYPQLKRNSFMSRVVASSPDHSSFKYNISRRDYFSHIGPGLYRLQERYVPQNIDVMTDDDLDPEPPNR